MGKIKRLTISEMEKTNDGVRKMIGGGNMEWTHLDNKLPPKKKDVLLYFDSRKMAVTERGGAFNA